MFPTATAAKVRQALGLLPKSLSVSKQQCLARRLWNGLRSPVTAPAGDWPWRWYQRKPVRGEHRWQASIGEVSLQVEDIPTQAESFRIILCESSLQVIGADERGLRYGLLALRSLRQSSLALPCLDMSDWPSLRERGITIDVGRVAERPETIKEVIRYIADQRANICVLYLEDKIQIPGHKSIASLFAYSKAVLRELADYAKSYLIDLLPSFSLFGHATHILNKPKYTHLSDGPQSYQLNPLHKETRELCRAHLSAWNKAVPMSPLVHMGCDETPYSGLCKQTCRYIEKHGEAAFFAKHVKFLYELCRESDQAMSIWGDMLRHHPDIIPLIPKDVVVYDWNYGSIPDSWADGIHAYKKAGLEVVAVPATSRSAEVFVPDKLQMLNNIPEFVAMALRENLRGVIVSTWEAMDLLSHFSRPGYGLGLRLAWEGDCSATRVKAHMSAASAAVFGENGECFLRLVNKHGSNHIYRHFRGIHFDNNRQDKTYHLLTHEIVATDPILYGTAKPSKWTRTLEQQYAVGAVKCRSEIKTKQNAEALLADATGWMSMMDGIRSLPRRQYALLREAYAAWQSSSRQPCAAILTQAAAVADELAQRSQQALQSAKKWWKQYRYLDDPEFDRCMARRWDWSMRSARTWRQRLQRSAKQARSGKEPQVFKQWQAQHVIQVRLPLSCNQVNILILDLAERSGASPWQHHLNIQAFQLPGSVYCYTWMPLTLPEQLRFKILRTQAPWTLAEADIDLYQLPDLTARPRFEYQCEDYRLGKHVKRLKLNMQSETEALLDFRL